MIETSKTPTRIIVIVKENLQDRIDLGMNAAIDDMQGHVERYGGTMQVDSETARSAQYTFYVAAQHADRVNDRFASFGLTMGEANRDYQAHAVRSLVLFYVGERFLWVTDRMQELRDRYSVVSNADAVLALLEESSGLEAPHEIG